MITRAAILASSSIAFAVASSTASAENLLGLYAGGAVGESHVRSEDASDDNPGCCMPLKFDASHAGWKLFAGVRPLPALGVEVAYIDFGTVTAPSPFPAGFLSYSDSSKQSAAALFGVGYLPIPVPFLDVYGKAGLAWLHTDQRVTVTSYACPPVGYGSCGPYTLRQDQSSTNFAFGVGAQAKLGAFAIRAEYEQVSASGGNPDLLSVGILWNF
jgi:Outer membrane protein beta-barrel domain